MLSGLRAMVFQFHDYSSPGSVLYISCFVRHGSAPEASWSWVGSLSCLDGFEVLRCENGMSMYM